MPILTTRVAAVDLLHVSSGKKLSEPHTCRRAALSQRARSSPGPWTADKFLIHHCGRADVLALDCATRRAMSFLFRKELPHLPGGGLLPAQKKGMQSRTDQKMADLAACWSPHRTMAT